MIKASNKLEHGYILISTNHNRTAVTEKTTEGWTLTHQSGQQKTLKSYQQTTEHLNKLGW